MKPLEEMSKEELNVFSKEVLHVCEEKRWHTQFTKAQSNPLDLFFSLAVAQQTIFSLISDPSFTEVNKALEHL